jgi:thiol-disulfide isomerase/thioredoxin
MRQPEQAPAPQTSFYIYMSKHPTGPKAASQSGLSTRRTLLTMVGLGAAGAGAWWAWQRQQGNATSPRPPEGDPLPANFWQQQFETPVGKPLAWTALQGQPVLLNFWATWCPPCVKEMPELDRFHREFAPQGWHVVGLAVDGPTPVREFLAKVGVGFDIGLAGFGGTELAQSLGNLAGGLPFSVLIDAQGRIRHRKMGATHFDELAGWARAMHPA